MSFWSGLAPEVISRNLLVDDLDVHILEARPPLTNNSPTLGLVILLHGFPELSYSWREVIVPLATAGYHVVAPDQRGYGRTRRRSINTTHEKTHFEDDLSPYRMLNLTKDIVALVYALGYQSAAAVVGHDFGSRVASYCSLIRPDLFKSVIIMSSPFAETQTPSFSLKNELPKLSLPQLLNEKLGGLTPPRKHYTVYYSTPSANADMSEAPQGLHSFLRAYYHVKSADWAQNQPYHLPSSSPSSFALIPNYYIMPLHETMAQVVQRDAPSAKEIGQNTWLTEEELAVYTTEYTETGFQGGLNWYRTMTDAQWSDDLMVFSGKRIEVPAMFISGKQDWGVFQFPGAAEKMREKVCEKMLEEDFVLVEGAGHWVQQEAPEAVIKHLLRFLKRVETSSS
ncbi:alpha/beta hydrolase fold protein [Tricholoma matsutake]|nr:alpha/beta hydrolase fold protein [Tricholoma matsutake 945]